MAIEQWEAYYRGGALATGPTGPDGSYDLEIRQVWVEFFATLRDGARILDVGTGNGVVALLAAETAIARAKKWEIHASDLADINPKHDLPDGARRLSGIQFHPRVATEKLPFESNSLDAVSGHYALEYTDTAKALRELHRVLKAGSEAQFILHSANSALIHNAKWTLHEAEFVLQTSQLYRHLHRLLTLGQAPEQVVQNAAVELRSAIQLVKAELANLQATGAGRTLSVALDAVQTLLRMVKQLRPQDLGLEIDRAEQELLASKRRQQDLVKHARSANDMEQIKQQAVSAGFSQIEYMPIHHDRINLVGWLLLMHRP